MAEAAKEENSTLAEYLKAGIKHCKSKRKKKKPKPKKKKINKAALKERRRAGRAHIKAKRAKAKAAGKAPKPDRKRKREQPAAEEPAAKAAKPKEPAAKEPAAKAAKPKEPAADRKRKRAPAPQGKKLAKPRKPLRQKEAFRKTVQEAVLQHIHPGLAHHVIYSGATLDLPLLCSALWVNHLLVGDDAPLPALVATNLGIRIRYIPLGEFDAVYAQFFELVNEAVRQADTVTKVCDAELKLMEIALSVLDKQ